MPSPDSLATPLSWALQYAEIGWHVLPIEPNQKRPLGKLVPQGVNDASADLSQIRSWWMRHPDAGIGIALAKSGLVAIDIDPRNGGTETFDALQADHGSLRSEVMAYTGGGGEHHVFVVPHGVSLHLPGTLGPGVDLKANGYIVVEPSRHPSGKAYAWEAMSNPLDGVAPSPLPDWLRSLQPQLKASEVKPGAVPVDPVRARDAREALYVLDADDYHEWVQAGMALHSTGWGQSAYAMWCAWAQQSSKFDAGQSAEKWKSFTAPESRANALTLAWVFGTAQKRGWANPAAGGGHLVQISGPVAAEQVSTGLPLVFAEDIQADSIRISQLVEDTITEGGLSVMYGESNSGKSFLACDMDCSIASGIEWLGKRTVRGAVLYVAGEGCESIKLRVLAWRQHHGVEPFLAVVPVAINLLDPGADVHRVVEAAKAVEEHYGMPVVKITVDTLARAFGGGNENASEDMGAVIHNADAIRLATKAHVMFVHHAGKDAAKGSRGHSSLKAATDTEIEVIGDETTKLHSVKFTKQRDLSSRGEELVAKFSVVQMGVGQWGKAITTCVVDLSQAEAPTRPANKAKASELHTALVVCLAKKPNRTLKRSALVKELADQGFKTSPIYRSIDQLVAQNVLTEVAGMVYLNGSGVPQKEADA